MTKSEPSPKRRSGSRAALTCACIAMLLACGDNDASIEGTASDAAVDTSRVGDTRMTLDGPADSARQPDVGACSVDFSAIGNYHWGGAACPASSAGFVDAHYTCDGGIPYYEQCGQREVLGWGWGTHGQTCFYEAGTLVGLVLADDSPSFCNFTASFIEIGDTAGCSGQGTNITFCNSKEDAGIVDATAADTRVGQDMGSIQDAGGAVDAGAAQDAGGAG